VSSFSNYGVLSDFKIGGACLFDLFEKLEKTQLEAEIFGREEIAFI